jgi:monovalent cation/hydrogen antiporter
VGSPYAINNDTRLDARQVFVIGGTGMRGVTALAAAISLPQGLADGSPFPHRNLTLFLTFNVILVTFVVEGLTLAPLIRALGLATTSGPDREEQEAHRMMLEATLAGDYFATVAAKRQDSTASDRMSEAQVKLSSIWSI